MNEKDVEVYPVSNGGNLLATVNFKHHGMIARDFRLIQPASGDIFLASPSRKFTAPDGQEKYRDIVFFVDKDLKNQALSIALAKYRAASAQK